MFGVISKYIVEGKLIFVFYEKQKDVSYALYSNGRKKL